MSKTSLPLASEEVKIRLKHRDWEVEITCLESKVKQVVENVLSGIDTSTTSVDSNSDNHIAELKREMDSLKLLINSIDTDQRQMTNTIESIQKVLPKGAINTIESIQKVLPKPGITCRGVLENLWHEGYFVSEKPLAEVHEELSRRGYNYHRTAVSHSLTDMVRESILTRVGAMRNYRYVQKRPHSELSL